MIALLMLLVLLGHLPGAAAQTRGQAPPARGQGARPQPARPQAPADTYFVNTLAPADMQNKQAVVETSMGTVVFDLLPEAAPNHVAHFITSRSIRAHRGADRHASMSHDLSSDKPDASDVRIAIFPTETEPLGKIRPHDVAVKQSSLTTVLKQQRRQYFGGCSFAGTA